MNTKDIAIHQLDSQVNFDIASPDNRSYLQQLKVGNQILCNTIPKPWSSDTLQGTHLEIGSVTFCILYLDPGSQLTIEAIYACHITTFMVSSCQCNAIRISILKSISIYWTR